MLYSWYWPTHHLALPLPFSRAAASTYLQQYPLYILATTFYHRISTFDNACLNKHVIRRRRLPPVICSPASNRSAEVDSGPVLQRTRVMPSDGDGDRIHVVVEPLWEVLKLILLIVTHSTNSVKAVIMSTDARYRLSRHCCRCCCFEVGQPVKGEKATSRQV